VATIFVATSCQQQPPSPKQQRTNTPHPNKKAAAARTPALDEDQIAELQALGYADAPTEPDDPTKKGVTLNSKRASPGYNLITDRRGCRASVLDNAGTEVHAWQGDDCAEWAHAVLLRNRDLLVSGVNRRGGILTRTLNRPRYLTRLTWDGHPVFRVNLPAHHLPTEMPDGRLIALTTQQRMAPGYDHEAMLLDDRLAVLTSRGTVLKFISLFDLLHENSLKIPLKPIAPSNKGHAKGIDLFHINTVNPLGRPELVGTSELFQPSNVLITLRHQDLIAVVDIDAEKVIWAWGQDDLRGPHDAQPLANGHFLMLDNGLGRGWSRAIEMDPATGKIVWEYAATPKESLYTHSYGTVNRTDNGNTIITDSDSGRALEVTPQGQLAWEFFNPNYYADKKRGPINSVRRYTADELSPWLNLKTPPPPRMRNERRKPSKH